MGPPFRGQGPGDLAAQEGEAPFSAAISESTHAIDSRMAGGDVASYSVERRLARPPGLLRPV
jgi:hypothetical protein